MRGALVVGWTMTSKGGVMMGRSACGWNFVSIDGSRAGTDVLRIEPPRRFLCPLVATRMTAARNPWSSPGQPIVRKMVAMPCPGVYV